MASTAYPQNAKITPHGAIAHRGRRNPSGAHLGIRTCCRRVPVHHDQREPVPAGALRCSRVKPAAKSAGLPAGVTSHDLRHHYAAVLLAAGGSVVAVAERLGHENATLVLRTYGHLMPDSEDRTRRAIDDAWTSDGTETESDH